MLKPEKKSSEKSKVVYSVVIKDRALKQFVKIPKKFAEKIDEKIQSIAIEPRPQGCVKMIGYENIYRVRFTDYRIVYSVEDRKLIVEIIQIGNRNDVYDILKRR